MAAAEAVAGLHRVEQIRSTTAAHGLRSGQDREAVYRSGIEPSRVQVDGICCREEAASEVYGCCGASMAKYVPGAGVGKVEGADGKAAQTLCGSVKGQEMDT